LTVSQINRRTLIQASGAAGLTMLTPGLARAATLPGRHDYGDIRDIEHTDLASYCLTVRTSPSRYAVPRRHPARLVAFPTGIRATGIA